jgi:hypothetical protein
MQIGKAMIQGGASTSYHTAAIISCVHMWLLWRMHHADIQDMAVPSLQNTNVQYKASGMWLSGMSCLLGTIPSIIFE